MSKKHFIRLADAIIRSAPADRSAHGTFSRAAILALADFCQEQNPNFNRDRWLSYIAGECGPCGGKVNRAA
jgi:hypothetical protein